MAKGNMILTLIANTSKFASGMKKASGIAVVFGKVVRGAMDMARNAILGIAGAVIFFIPSLIKMGEEARKSERRLQNIAEQVGVFGEKTDAVVASLSRYAEELSFITGVDDEVVRGAEAILLTFENLAKTADDANGVFQRSTVALLDLAAAGFGEATANAKKLGKMLENPVENLTALSRAGIQFTAAEKAKITALTESGKLLQAQDLILDKIEGKVGGTAEATASATERMNARFEDVLETLSESLLPAVDAVADAFGAWLDSAEGKKAIDELTDSIKEFSEWITSAKGVKAVEDFAGAVVSIATAVTEVGNAIQWVIDIMDDFAKNNKDFFDGVRDFLGVDASGNFKTDAKTSGNKSAPGGAKASVVVNFNAPVDSVSAGREVARVLSDYNRTRGMR